jgi:hypothetical protein
VTEVLIYVAFAICVVGPFLPGILVLISGRDASPLHVDPAYSRDPRYLGLSLRQKIAPIMADAPAGTRMRFLDRGHEFARVVDDCDTPDGMTFTDVIISRGPSKLGKRTYLLDVFAREGIDIGAESKLRSASTDGDLRLGERSVVARWLDAGRGIVVGRGSDLGLSASATSVLSIDEGTKFRRVFGHPVFVSAPAAAVPNDAQTPVFERAPGQPSERELHDGGRFVSAGETVDADIIAKEKVELKSTAVVRGSIKSNSDVVLNDNSIVYGNIVARGNVKIGNHCAVTGHVFAERSIAIGSETVVGTPGRPKTVQALEAVSLSAGARIYGWVIAENGGTVLEGVA